MTQKEIIEYLKKNKTVAFGIPAIVMILLLDNLVLKPARLAKKNAGRPDIVATVPVTNMSFSEPVAKEPIPEIIPLPTIGVLVDENFANLITRRFSDNRIYKTDSGRNVFMPLSDGEIVVTSDDTYKEKVVIQRPDITYHGFFTIGNDKVAILRSSNELLLTKVGSLLRRTPFLLRSVRPEKVVIADETDAVKEFEISLSENR